MPTVPSRLVARPRVPLALSVLAGAAVLGAAALEALVLSHQAPRLLALEGWHYFVTARPPGPSSVFVVLAAGIALLGSALFLRLPISRRLALVVLAGVVLELGYGLVEDRGMFAIRDRVLNAGHREFAEIATTDVTVRDVLWRYEAKVTSGAFGGFSATKPPGTLLFYVLTERVANALMPYPNPSERKEWFATFASFVWPWLSMLSVVPLYGVGRTVADEDTSVAACALAVTVPSLLLITMHTDQVLFPLVLNSALALSVASGRRDSLPLAMGAGIVFYAAAFCSFGLLAAAPLFGLGAVLGATSRPRAAGPTRRWLWTSARTAGAAVLGFFLMAWAASRLLGYDMNHRYTVAIAKHIAWKSWHGTDFEVKHFAMLNALEFVVYLGAPVAVLCVLGAAIGSVDATRARYPNALLIALVVVSTVAFLAFFGRTKAESARLWFFLAEPACLAASLTIHRVFPTRGKWVTGAVALAQLFIVLDVKRFQDFH